MHLICLALLFYSVVIWAKSESGFHSWHPVKRVLAFVFLPLALFHWLAVGRCNCGQCPHCREWEDW